MTPQHLIRVGTMGHVGRFASVDGRQYPRRSRVICRTRRGLEVGQVLSPAPSGSSQDSDGSLLRGMTSQDELLLGRLEKNKVGAYQACCRLLDDHQLGAVLMDVEVLFDGQSLYFYFLGEVTPELDVLTAQLADVYEANVQFRKFAEVLTVGCGPGCGTEEATGGGCGSGNCGSCLASSVCGAGGGRSSGD